MSARFDPMPDKPHGVCVDCGIEIADSGVMSAHFAETRVNGGGRSHTIRNTNPTRARRIENALEDIAESALYEFVEEASRLIDDGDATEAEITEALRTLHADFSDAWADRS